MTVDQKTGEIRGVKGAQVVDLVADLVEAFGDPLQASQLTVCFADEHEAKFGFIGQDDLFAVANAISRRIL